MSGNDFLQYIKENKARISALTAENTRLRKMLWMRHGCDISALYGDDGEMQCGRCIIDFRRDPADQIQQRFRHLGQMQALAAREGGKG